jgi:hypothetical protein
MQIKLLIDGVDRTSALLEQEWEIECNAMGSICNARFTLDDPNKSISVVEGKDCIVEKSDDVNTRYFGGKIVQVARITRGLGRRLTCTALGWEWILSRTVHNVKYVNKSDKYIINEAVATPKGLFSHADLSSFDATTHVQEGYTDTRFLQVKGENTRQILETLADMSGYAWYVDFFKKLHYKPYGIETHSFSLSDDPDDVSSFAYSAMVATVDITRLFNRVEVHGGRKRTIDVTETYANSGGAKITPAHRVWLPTGTDTKIKVNKNTGTDGSPTWTAQAVGLKNNDDDQNNLGSTIDVLWDQLGQTLQWNTAPSNFTNSYQVRGDFITSFRGLASDQVSIDTYGRYTYTVKDQSINSDEQAEARAYAELRKHVKAVTKVTLRTTKDGIEAGKSIRIVNSILGIDRTDLVERVVIRLLGGTVALYDVTLVRQPEAV